MSSLASRHVRPSYAGTLSFRRTRSEIVKYGAAASCTLRTCWGAASENTDRRTLVDSEIVDSYAPLRVGELQSPFRLGTNVVRRAVEPVVVIQHAVSDKGDAQVGLHGEVRRRFAGRF